MITDKRFQEMIDAQSCRKTNYLAPHEYFIRKDNAQLYDEIAHRFKNCKTVKREFQGSTWTYYIFNGYRYWIFKILVNRAKEG